ncbi:hypothetical protein DFS33DRAFT_1450646 [Desarmillaria ectypa]|nr:hypothetical protein DFS33DRAFT_1450646 [Desarmillaria ectypa]
MRRRRSQSWILRRDGWGQKTNTVALSPLRSVHTYLVGWQVIILDEFLQMAYVRVNAPEPEAKYGKDLNGRYKGFTGVEDRRVLKRSYSHLCICLARGYHQGLGARARNTFLQADLVTASTF